MIARNSIAVNPSEISCQPLPDDKYKLENADSEAVSSNMPASILVSAARLL
jgi:hypothetical protein